VINLRPYQQELIEKARRKVADGVRRLLIVAPTGAGKTHILAHNMLSFLERRKDGVALYVVHRRQLVEQTHALLTRLGLPATIVMAGYETDWSKRIFVVSRDTWIRRRDELNFDNVPLLIFDEAHIGVGAQKRIVEAIEPGIVLGYTATPVSVSGPGMGALYDDIVVGPTYLDLIADGHLVPTRWVSVKLDTSDLRVSKLTGDFVIDDVVRLVRGQVLADLYEAYGAYAGERTVVFAPTVDTAWTIAARFGEMGIPAAVLDWSTPTHERHRILGGFRNGRIKIIVNVDVLSEGWDEPLVDTIILASPTRSLARYLQRVGRGMRPAEGKVEVLVIDLVGSLYMHGPPEDIAGWELEPERPDRKKPAGSGLVKRRGLCPVCRAEMKSNPCQNCGFRAEYKAEVKDLEVIGAKIGVVDEVDTEQIRVSFYRQLLGIARAHGKKDGWAAHAYKDKYGEWPPFSWKELGPMEPGPEAQRWAKRMFIKWAKRRPLWKSTFGG
jgi:superfamily II DNA or RNA helicase